MVPQNLNSPKKSPCPAFLRQSGLLVMIYAPFYFQAMWSRFDLWWHRCVWWCDDIVSKWDKVGPSGTPTLQKAFLSSTTVRQNFKKISRWSQTNLICFLRSHPFSEERNVRLLWWRRRGAIFSHLRWFYLLPKNISLSLLPWLWPRTKENLCNILWLLKTSIVWFDRKYKMALFFCCQIFPNHG